MSKRRRRGRRGRAAVEEAARAKSERKKHGRKNPPLTREQQDHLHRLIAEAKVLGVQVRPRVRRRWIALNGAPLAETLLDYYCFSPRLSAQRSEYLRSAMSGEDLELAATLNVTNINHTLDEIVKAAFKERTVDIKTARVLGTDGAWRDEVVRVAQDSLEIALKAVSQKQALLVQCGRLMASVSARPAGGSRRTPDEPQPRHGKMQPIRGMGGGLSDVEDVSTDPEVAELLLAQENKPFGATLKDETYCSSDRHSVMSARSHSEMVRRWEEDGLTPDGFPSKPTRIVRKDGSVVILEGDDDLPRPSGLDEPERAKIAVGEELDLGVAVLDPAASDGE